MSNKINHLCIGCGLCAALCPQDRIRMQFDDKYGYYLPNAGKGNCESKSCNLCERVCPFIPENLSTLEITTNLFEDIPDIHHDDTLGYYISNWVGYSKYHRMKSASGGMTTWFLEKLMEMKEVDSVICVGSDESSETLFKYKICKSVDEIRNCSGSCYQPLELSLMIREVLRSDGRFAIVTLPCVARSMRLAMNTIPRLKKKINFILGLTCGQCKSRHYVDYLGESLKEKKRPVKVEFRNKKDMGMGAHAFGYRYYYRDQSGFVTERDFLPITDAIKVFCERKFTLEACDYCDDVFAECADAVFMDAWLAPYSDDWQGNNIVSIRHPKLESLVSQYLGTELQLQPICTGDVLSSQVNPIRQKRVYASLNSLRANKRRMPQIRCNVDMNEVNEEELDNAFYLRNMRKVYQGKNRIYSKIMEKIIGKTLAMRRLIRKSANMFRSGQ